MDNALLITGLKKSFGKSLLYSLPMVLITFMFMTGGRPDFSDPSSTLAILIAFLLVNVLYFMMHYTGKTDRFRAVLPMMILPAAFTKSIIFPGSILGGFADISSMAVLWLVATLALGRGFCSWGCFYGGWDDGFSRLGKKPFLKKISQTWKYMPFAVLIMVALTAALTLSPTYCGWICPFKAVTEFEQVTSVESAAKAGIFISLFAGLVVVLPVMTKKRTQCSFLCPLGAVNSLSNKVTPFTIKIDKKACTECYKCVGVCPLLALTPQGIKDGKVSVFCSKCGRCVDSCSSNALHFGIKGVPAGSMKKFSRNLFLFVSFLFIAVFSAGTIINSIRGLLNLVF
jgi:ferredoxin-type protein NapH